MKRLDEEFRDHFTESGGFQAKRSAEDEKLKTFLESSVQSHSTLFEFLMKQAKETFEDIDELDAAEAIIGNFDERGFLEMPLEEIALIYDVTTDILEEVLEEIRTFEPFGIGAFSVKESLLIQLTCLKKKESLAYQIVANHYEDLLYNRIPQIKKSLGCSADEISNAIQKDISKLNLYPGALHAHEVVQNITADVVVRNEKESLIVEIDDEYIPSLKLNAKYLQMLESNELTDEVKDYIRNKVASGKWLLRNIHQRNDTLLKITNLLVEKQGEYFKNPKGQLLPLTMKSVAEELELHESTVARAVSNKYVDCSRGLLALRSFFTNSYSTNEGDEISSRTVKDLLQEIVGEEDKAKPLSDEALSKLIKAKGIPCARRTVAKYRRELNLGNAAQRRIYT
jgi:RNA polymerase sigma-54 factor